MTYVTSDPNRKPSRLEKAWQGLSNNTAVLVLIACALAVLLVVAGVTWIGYLGAQILIVHWPAEVLAVGPYALGISIVVSLPNFIHYLFLTLIPVRIPSTPAWLDISVIPAWFIAFAYLQMTLI